MNGWRGNIIRVDLSSGTWRTETLPATLLQKFIGGRGLGGYYLRPYATCSPDDPALPLILLTGPLVGTNAPTSGRMAVVSKSPLTGAIADASVGGSLGTALKKAGYDGIIITGKAPCLSGIEIHDAQVRLTRATHLAGKGTAETGHALKGKGATAAVGPAAENKVLFANIMIDGHYSAGRTGLGYVFAGKNLKYITVKGAGRVTVANPEKLKQASRDILRLVSASPVLSGKFGITHFGTAALYDLMDARNMMPTKNFRKTRFSNAASMNAFAYHQQYTPSGTGCRGCHIRCKKKTGNGDPLPEFETMSHFSALLDNHDKDTVMAANRICNDMGMDTISAGATLACFAEISNERLSPEHILQLLADIGHARGIGVALGQGAARYATSQNRPETAMTVKNLELSAYDPRGAYGMALAFAVSTRGACHLRAYPISHEILRKPVATDRLSFEGKARIIKISEDMNAVVDSLTACKFVFFAATLEEYANVYEAVTGMPATAHDLLAVGERIIYQERMINAANGFDKKQDDLPERFFTPAPAPHGDVAPPVDRKAFLNARDNYYIVRGLDADGNPLAEKAGALGLLPALPAESDACNSSDARDTEP